MTTYQLPPMSLQFGSDTTSGFTEPKKYDTISQSSRTNGPRQILYGGSSRNIRQQPLPSVSQLLTPSGQPKGPLPPPYSPQRGPNPPSPPRSLSSQQRGPQLEQDIRASPYSIQSSHVQQVPVQLPSLMTANPVEESHPISSSLQRFPSSYVHQRGPSISSYASSFGPSQQSLYSSHSQPFVPPNLSRHQNFDPSNASQLQAAPQLDTALPQQMSSVNAPPNHFPGPTSDHEAASMPVLSSEQTLPVPSNSVKPLPRVIAERDIPGEGPSWVYEDGTTCKKIIDGEAVNAQWGITKAGKPRKRLAIACTTCREKKIKCDPAEPKCVQCEKFGRECRFTTAFRIQRGSPDSLSYDFQARPSFVSPKSESSPVQKRTSSTLKSPRIQDQKTLKRRKSSPDTSHIKIEEPVSLGKVSAVKRRRSSLLGLFATKPEQESLLLKSVQTAPESVLCQVEDPTKVCKTSFDWCNDPFQIDAELSIHYLETYFDYHDKAIHQLFPRKPFLEWVRLSKRKTPEDLMTLYAMLAVGSIFSLRSDRTSHGSSFCNIAKCAAESNQRNLSLQLMQSRLLLAIYHSSVGELQISRDYQSMAIRAASDLRLNVEIKRPGSKGYGEFAYGLNQHAIEECHRRAFWSAYISDRLSGFSPGHVCTFRSEDIYLRLPCKESHYEEQEYVETLYFDNGLIDRRLCEVIKSPEFGWMANTVQISSLWSDIQVQIFRSAHRTSANYLDDFETFYDTTTEKLSSWWRSLPNQLTHSKLNGAVRASDGDVGCLVNVHAIYHAAVIRLNRNIRYQVLPDSTIGRSIKEALVHAQDLLRMIQTIKITVGESQTSCPLSCCRPDPTGFVFSTAFVGYAIFLAVDVLSAGGSLKSCSDSIRLMENGLAVFERLNRFWASARVQSHSIRQRIDKLLESTGSRIARNKRAWRCSRPLDLNLQIGQDVFYDAQNTGCKGLLHHLGETAPEQEVLVVD